MSNPNPQADNDRLVLEQIVDLRSETKQQISEIRSELKEQISEIRSEMREQLSEMRSEMRDMRNEMKQQREEMHDFRIEMVRQFEASNAQIAAVQAQIAAMQVSIIAAQDRLTKVETEVSIIRKDLPEEFMRLERAVHQSEQRQVRWQLGTFLTAFLLLAGMLYNTHRSFEYALSVHANSHHVQSSGRQP